MPSFDVVSKVDLQEVENALNQAKKEISQRYDFRGTNTEVELTPEGIVVKSADKEHVSAAYKVLMERFVKRNVSLRALDAQEPQPGAKSSMRQLIKDAKLKVQAQIQDEQVRVTGKNKDDLQATIRLLRSQGDEIGLDLQYINFRD